MGPAVVCIEREPSTLNFYRFVRHERLVRGLVNTNDCVRFECNCITDEPMRRFVCIRSITRALRGVDDGAP